jgi:hypothetical protein
MRRYDDGVLVVVIIVGAIIVFVGGWLLILALTSDTPSVPNDTRYDVQRVCIEGHSYYMIDEGVGGQGRAIALAPVLQDDGSPVHCVARVEWSE